jgi:hypothetical protein
MSIKLIISVMKVDKLVWEKIDKRVTHEGPYTIFLINYKGLALAYLQFFRESKGLRSRHTNIQITCTIRYTYKDCKTFCRQCVAKCAWS